MIIIQIVPQLPPSINGVGDYSFVLARQLLQDFGMRTYFIVGDPTWTTSQVIEDFPIKRIARHSPQDLMSALREFSPAAAVLLHYVGYGYAQRGCPVWLVEGLERWKTDTGNTKLVTMFHEISASGAPWTSAFWLSRLQKNLAARLTKLSEHCITSKQLYAEVIYKLGQGKQTQITTIPVFSNIGEPKKLPLLAERTRRLVVFGHRNSRLQVYQQCRPALAQICQSLQIEEIYDIGVPIDLNLSEIDGIKIQEKGITEAAEVSKILLDSVAGFLNFPPPTYLAKSTIFAAYCAHRLIPCMASSSAIPIDGLQRNKHYWCADYQSSQLYLEQGQEIADSAFAWYQTHNLSAQAKIFATHLGQ